jgi:hypothetical protein
MFRDLDDKTCYKTHREGLFVHRVGYWVGASDLSSRSPA